MRNSSRVRFPVTVTRLPVSRCQVCQRTVASKAGQASAALTEHYRREHPDLLAAASERPA
jgi:hypothetical protein